MTARVRRSRKNTPLRTISDDLRLDIDFDLDVYPAILISKSAQVSGRILLSKQELYRLMMEIAEKFDLEVIRSNVETNDRKKRSKKMNTDFNVETLKSDVVKNLVANFDYDMEEAEEMVETSFAENPDMWNENAEVSDLARFLDSEDND